MAKNVPSIDALSPADQALMNAQLSKLNRLQSDLAKLGAEEKTLRLEMMAKWFPNPVEGSTNKFAIGYGKLLELNYRINRRLDESALDMAVMGGTIPPELISQVVRYKPEVSAYGYKALDDAGRLLFADIVTEEPGTPGLKIITPKRA